MIVIPTKQGQVPVPIEATIAFDDDALQACVELEYVPFFSFQVFEMIIITEVCVMYFHS